MDQMSSADDQAQATQELVSAPVGDRCANCQTPLAADQRYCVNCGERRGKARFSFETVTAKAAPAPPPAPPRGRPHLSSSFNFILGVAVLLLALGVGVLIGHNNNTKSTPAASATPQVIKIQGGGGSGTSNAGTGTSTPTTGAFKASKAPKLTTKVVKKVQAAAAKVLGSSKNLSNKVDQQVGQSCSGGSGCQGGKFTGNYFGGG